MTNKYRVHELAKDFNMANKDITDTITPVSQGEKNHMTALEEPELNYFFDKVTTQHSVDGFDRYYKSGEDTKRIRQETAEKKAADEKKKALEAEVKTRETASAAATLAREDIQRQATAAIAEKKAKDAAATAAATATPVTTATATPVTTATATPVTIATAAPVTTATATPVTTATATPVTTAAATPVTTATATPVTTATATPVTTATATPVTTAATAPQGQTGFSPRPQGVQGQTGFSPRPQGVQGQTGFSPRPQGVQGQTGFSPRPQGVQGQTGFSPRPQGVQGQTGFSPRPQGVQGQTGYAPRPQGTQGQTGYAPRPQGTQGQTGYAPRPQGTGGYAPRPAGTGAPRPQGGFNKPGGARPGGNRPTGQGGGDKDDYSPGPRFLPNAPKKIVPPKPMNEQTTRREGVRVVDTRGSTVDLAKYDDRFENMAGDRARNMAGGKERFKKQNNRPTGYQAQRRETEAEKLKRLALEKARKAPLNISIPAEIVVSELATRLKKTNAEVVKRLFLMGSQVTANDTIDFDAAALVAEEFKALYTREVVVTIEELLIDVSEDAKENLQTRSPIVVVMGHVDHGKTSLLDAIRNTSVTDGEAGGITQHIGAYKVFCNDREIAFLDTPGHAAFTSMRARGANVTDIAILVIAADDGIMPQTIEAINHAKAAGVSIIIAINKIDKPTADLERVKQALTEHNLVPEEWGGDVICVPVSAKTKEGIDTLLEMVLLTADMLELRANPTRAARGTVVEARLDKSRGPVATVLVQNGTLHVGDVIIAGSSVGRVRAMTDDRNHKIEHAGPSTPVEIIGLSEVPQAGDIVHAVEDEKMARELASERRTSLKNEIQSQTARVSLDDLFAQIQQGNVKDLNLIVKADVQGSFEAVKSSLEKLANPEVKVKVIHGGVGAISSSDLMLAEASNAIVIGFNVRPDITIREDAEARGIDIRTYRIIYECLEEIETAMNGLLAPKFREVIMGHAEIRQVFKVTGSGTIAGSYVKSGKITRNSLVRLLRDSVVIAETKVEGLRRFKDDVKEVATNFECGISLENYSDMKEGDIVECYIVEEYKD